MADSAICSRDWQNQKVFFRESYQVSNYRALSSPMNILSTAGVFWVNEVSRAG